MKQHVRASFQQIHPSCELHNLPGLKSFHLMFQLYIVIHAGAFKIYFAAVVMVLGGVSLLINQKLDRFLVKPRFEFVMFPQFRSRLSVCGALRRQPIVWTISKLFSRVKYTNGQKKGYTIVYHIR